ncbi:AbrB/MazE/SpoVT family DNA-binding domain-containing protein [Pseudomonas luteola]|uniref:AbrB/MazE/SpoVT family DNA-binding domain-containing protein n=1 Tax=Pseudomonas TaxID=286 RepID=UPI0002CA1785|nr:MULTISPECIES: AbrB/MazE/SpoVT family DNA-binding domain-containing protein [Pseudomonas]ENA27501.1 AbrB family transcriptional regulator [Pseudomonas sp. HPB0071]RRW39797.1 AbrB/MazE/SpoVT family DNA-binding domain-containing protein [Pseudomonas luteola]
MQNVYIPNGPTSTVTSKGQVTIPAHVREELHLDPGTRIQWVKVAPNTYQVIAATLDVTELAGMLAGGDVKLTIEEMNEAIVNEGAKGADA